jgi:nicotinate-nucleotide--dimethylbenzimidazole phosphoribosyltransferase
VNRLDATLTRVFGDPPVAPRAVVRIQVASGQGLVAGRQEADRLVDAGCELVVLDSDATTPGVRACLAALLALEPTEVTDRAAADWAEQVVAVRALLRAARPVADDPVALLEAVDDPALGRLVGLVAGLAERRTPVLVGSGTATAAGVLVASRLQPDLDRWLIVGSAPQEPAASQVYLMVGLDPLLELGLTTGSADIAAALVRAGLDHLGA